MEYNNYQDLINDYPTEKIVKSLIEKIRNFYQKNKISGFVIGMSGGLDCSVVATLCKLADVPIIAVSLTYRVNDSKQRINGVNHGKILCDKFNIPFKVIDISETVDTLYKQIDLNFEIPTTNIKLSKANVLPRIRMVNLYYLAQLNNFLVIGTGNLSEITMGYFTKWGDGANDFNPIKKITKTEIFKIAEYLNIPQEIIDKKPSADLWDEQNDEEEMGLTYFDIDSYIRGFKVNSKVIDIVEKAKTRNKHKMLYNLLLEDF